MTTELVTCYRHHDRRAGVSCQRCGRPICPSCMVQASVGFHCPECTQAARGQVTSARELLETRPVVTYALIGINALFFVAAVATATSLGSRASLWQLPRGGLADWGLLLGHTGVPFDRVNGVANGEWWRIVTGGFLHAGILHIGMNMLVLWLLGSQLERVVGGVKFACLYLTSLLAGSLGVLLIDPTAPTVGASGAVFGLMGAAFVFQRSRGIDPWSSGLGGLILLNLLITFFVPGISKGGHIGGLIGGAIAGILVFQLERVTRSVVPAVALCAGLSVAFFVGSLWAALRERAQAVSTSRFRLRRFRFQTRRSTSAPTTPPSGPPIHHGKWSCSRHVNRVRPGPSDRRVKRPVPDTAPVCRTPIDRRARHSVISI
jgi:membrane associated rhomboid family serine protease